MSISSGGTRKAGPFNGNGVTTAFPFTFKVFQASDLLVVQTDTTPTDNTLALTTDYTVSLNANQDSNPGGTVTMNVAPPTGYLLTIGSQVPQLQSVTLTNNGGFYPTVINNALDYVTILIQQLSEKIGRALTMPFSTNASGQLPPVSPGSLLGWNQAGTGIANVGATGVGAGGIVASNMAAGATGTALSTDTQAAATKATPADADKIPLFDSAAFWGLKSLTWANLKAAFKTYFSTLVGTQVQISSDLSPLWWGTQSTLSSGAAYTLNGNILIMEARCHNTQIDTSGNFTGVSETGIATVMFWGEDDVIRVFTAPSVTAGTVPTFGANPTYMLDMKTGAGGPSGKNYFLNPSFNVWQDSNGNGATYSWTSTTTGHAADMTLFNAGTGGTPSKTVSRQAWAKSAATNVNNNPYYYQSAQTAVATVTADSDFFGMESAAVFQGGYCTVSALLWCAAGTLVLTPTWLQNFGTGGSPSASTSTAPAGPATITITTTPTLYQFTFSVPSTLAKTFGSNGNDYCGLNLARPLNATSTLNVDSLKIEAGQVATSFRAPQGGEDGLQCRRYYKIRGGNTVADISYLGYNASAAAIVASFTFEEMRAIPTIAKVGTWTVSNCSQPSINAAGMNTFSMQSAITTSGAGYFQTANAGTYVSLDARLF